MELQKQIQEYAPTIEQVQQELHKKIIGQETLIRDVLIWLLSGGHVLLEWVPGVAKTLTIDTLSQALDINFKRIQFTPDLLPSDLVGTEIYNMSSWDFSTKKGPIFTNLLLADEINRAPSKVQSALLEAMAEKQVTIWEETYNLDEPFVVLATQNPIEQSWTYPLPEAELDRFMLKSKVDYPTKKQEIEILTRLYDIENGKTKKILSASKLLKIKKTINDITVSENIIAYISNIIDATRKPNTLLRYWVSPRWSIALLKAAKVIAFLDKRDFVIPEDVKTIAISVIAHRLVLSYEAIAEEISNETVAEKIIAWVKIK